MLKGLLHVRGVRPRVDVVDGCVVKLQGVVEARSYTVEAPDVSFSAQEAEMIE